MEFRENQAIYLQIADLMCENVLGGAWKPGERIPSIREMAESIVKQIKVEPELTPSIAEHIKAEAERMKAANLLRQMPDWAKVMRPDLMAKAKT